MFWNDPNLYSVAFKDIPNVPTPFWGSLPRTYNPYLAPYVNPAMFTPQLTPQFTPQFTQQFTPQFAPQLTPFLHATPNLPWMDRSMIPYGYNFPFPYFQAYRPFGL